MIILHLTEVVLFTSLWIIIFLIAFFSSLQFILIGIVGAYIAKMYIEIKNRPVYLVKEKLGFNDETIL